MKGLKRTRPTRWIMQAGLSLAGCEAPLICAGNAGKRRGRTWGLSGCDSGNRGLTSRLRA